MASFCTRCGANIGNSTKCPRCGKRVKKPADKKPPIDRRLRLIAAILAGALALVMLLAVLVYYDVLNIPFINDIFISMDMKDAPGAGGTTNEAATGAENADEYTVEYVDADEAFDEISTVLSSFDVKSSPDLHSESEAYANLTGRGFTQYEITTTYDIEGNFSLASAINEHSSAQHPIYETYYRTESGEVWLITETNGTVTATPFSYNLESGEGNQLIYSELETVIGYDGVTNKFYLIEPDRDYMVVIVVDYIDAETLENINLRG